jgi:hypothetical protein
MKLNSITTHSFFALTLSLLGVGCGESVQGTYVGDHATVFSVGNEFNCAGEVADDYQITVQLQISGDSVQTAIVSLHRPGENISRAEQSQTLTGYAVNADLSDDTNFVASHVPFKDSRTIGDRTENASVSGSLTPDRGTLNNFQWTYEGFVHGTSQRCSVGVRATSLHQ